MYDLDFLRRNPASRRQFLATMGAAGLGLAATNLLAGGVTASANPNKGNVKFRDAQRMFPGIPGGTVNTIVLNYALTLEILEADLYRQSLNIASGRDIQEPLGGNPNAYTRQVKPGEGFDQRTANVAFLYVLQYAYIEATHREFLATAITAAGETPTTRNPGGYRYAEGPGEDMKAIVTNLLPLEETGVRAYLGALPYITDLNLASVAGGIYSTEARHSASLAYTLGRSAGPVRQAGDLSVSPKQQTLDSAFEFALAPSTVISAVSAYFR